MQLPLRRPCRPSLAQDCLCRLVRCLAMNSKALAGSIFAAGGMTVIAQAAQAAELAGSKPSSIVFICEHGISKSLVAAMLFNRMAEQRGLAVRAVSRAAGPQTLASKVPARLMQNLDGDGFPVRDFQRKGVRPGVGSGAGGVAVDGSRGSRGGKGGRAEE